MRKIYSIVFIALSLSLKGFSQNFTGYLVDENYEPVEFANIILLSKGDSTLIKGTISDGSGHFTLPIPDPGDCLIKISSLCYKTLYIENLSQIRDTIRLASDAQLLGEVVIKGRRNIVKKGNGKLIASIENTVLSYSGSAIDVLTRLPLLIENNDGFQVMGKGSPLIYINNRPIQDNSELLRLKSNEIKSVEIITTPGVEYNSSVTSVIRILTLPLKGEGFSGNFQTYSVFSKRMSEYVNANLKYRYKGLDVFVEGDILDYRGKYTRSTEYIATESNLYHGDARLDRLKSHIGGGANYMISPDQSLGVRYNLNRVPRDTDKKSSIVVENNNGEYDSFSQSKSDSYKNYLNFYYNGKFSDMVIDLNVDYSTGKESGHSMVEEYKEQPQLVNFSYRDNYDLFASKLLLKYPVKNHTFLFGGEYSNTNRKSNQRVLSGSNVSDLFSSSNKNEQQLGAVFANYDLTWNEFYASLGLRYEYTVFNYFEDNVKVAEQSKIYKEFIPTVSIGFEADNWEAELSFKKYVDRPEYDDLSNKISYVAYCARWSGNPFLIPSVNSELEMQFSWNDFTIIGAVERNKRHIFEVNQKYQDKPNVILVIPVNLPTYNTYSLDVSYNTQVGSWHPSLDVCLQYQDLKYGDPVASYNKPIGELLQRNFFQFKHNFSALLTLGYRTKGNFATAHTKGYTNLGISVSKSFLNKSLQIKLDCKDILNKYRESISVMTNGMSMIDNSKGNTRIFQFTLTYYFNKSSNRYKGKGAALEEINRL